MMSFASPFSRILQTVRRVLPHGGMERQMAIFTERGERVGLIADDGGCGRLLGEGQTVPGNEGEITLELDSPHDVTAETVVSVIGAAVTCRFRPMRFGRRSVNGFRARVLNITSANEGGRESFIVRLRMLGRAVFIATGGCGEKPQVEAPKARIWRGDVVGDPATPDLVVDAEGGMLINVSSAGVRFSTLAEEEPVWRDGDAVAVEVALPGESGEPPLLLGEVRTVERRDDRDVVGVRFLSERGPEDGEWRTPTTEAKRIDVHTVRLMRGAVSD